MAVSGGSRRRLVAGLGGNLVVAWLARDLRASDSFAATERTPNAAAPVPERFTATTVASTLTVTSVKDGDTVILSDGREVRLAQVDAPEKNECYGSQSTAALTDLVAGKTITLRRPSNGPERDKYGRTLGELSADGESVDEELVREGAAKWYDEFAHEDADIARRLERAEQEARSEHRGLWAACYGGGATSPTVAPQRFVATPVADGDCHPGYPDDCLPASPDLDCPDVGHRIRVDRSHGDPHRLDADRDGWGCE